MVNGIASHTPAHVYFSAVRYLPESQYAKGNSFSLPFEADSLDELPASMSRGLDLMKAPIRITVEQSANGTQLSGRSILFEETKGGLYSRVPLVGDLKRNDALHFLNDFATGMSDFAKQKITEWLA